jgi:hypothetical protein
MKKNEEKQTQTKPIFRSHHKSGYWRLETVREMYFCNLDKNLLSSCHCHMYYDSKQHPLVVTA